MATPFANEFKEMVNHLHAGGIELILDVVYNHTAEGNEGGPTLSFKGIDNASYYRLPENKRHYINDTGTGNTLNLSHSRVLQMVGDSLRYWATNMGVDGFRFDLATILAREPYGFDEGGGFLDSCRQDPVLSGLKLIAEPWDVGPGGYQVSRFPPGWAEWNDRFRDTAREFWKGGDGKTAEMATRMAGSADMFNRRGRRPWASINFITAHDGFNLNDLVSYNDKHNEANGEENRDGSSNNQSANYGAEGPTDDPAINAVRDRQKRNLLATLLLSQGTPMLLAGDEIGRTQRGNNNGYAQDNEINWIDWGATGEKGMELLKFTRSLIRLRSHHPVLQRDRFLAGWHNPDSETKDVTWLTPDATEMADSQWTDPNAKCFGMMIDGRAQPTGLKQPGTDETLLVVMNAYHDAVNFKLPTVGEGVQWLRLCDTNDPKLNGSTPYKFGDAYLVTGRSLLLFLLQRNASSEPKSGRKTPRRRAPANPDPEVRR
jgi:glycogen operon protein